MKTKSQKQSILQQITENLQKQQSILFVDYKGIKVKDLSLLRAQLKEVGAKFEVAKKTLFAKVFKEKGIDIDFKNMEGQIAAVYSFEDPVAGAKTAYTFAKKNEHIKLLAGYMESQLLTKEQVMELAQLPSREQLLARLVGTLAAPMQGLVTVLTGNLKGLITVLSKAKT
ncbi:MAG: 50S ribosomal protein L10 [bacterium]|nr:50S ribosomal protein L10 [bacterium]